MSADQFHGMFVGLVEDLEDPDALGRVRVRFPCLEDVVSEWARIVVVGGGADRGISFRPEIGDEVAVAFEACDFRRPLVMGGLWSRSDSPPTDDGETALTNIRQIRSRSGHVIKLDDTDGAELIEVVDSSGEQKITLDANGEGVSVTVGNGDVTVNASSGSVTVEAASEVNVKASAAIKLEAPSINIEASGELVLKGAVVRIN